MPETDIDEPVVPNGTQPDAGERASGFYWIDAAGNQVEVARWDADTQVWHLIGQLEAVPDDEVSVLSDLIEEPLG